MKLTRDWYTQNLPANAQTITRPNVDAIAYAYETPYGLCAIGFIGKQSKPAFRYRFPDEAQRAKYIDQFFTNVKGHADHKAQRAQERKEYEHDYQVGDILTASWGYDMVNVDFWQVVAVPSPKTILVRPVAQKCTSDGWLSGHTVPVPGQFTDKAVLRKVSTGGYVISLHYARKWSGKPEFYDHAD